MALHTLRYAHSCILVIFVWKLCVNICVFSDSYMNLNQAVHIAADIDYDFQIRVINQTCLYDYHSVTEKEPKGV
jgi:hypothetical protein